MEELTFNITNNPWLNNGLVRLTYELRRHFSSEVQIEIQNNSVTLISNTEKDLIDYISEVIKFLAADGTYNQGQVFKLINKHLNGSFVTPKPFPDEKGDGKKKEKVSKELRDGLKEKGINRSFQSSEQIWKMRISYLGSEANYLNFGLDFSASDFVKKLIEDEGIDNICLTCGCHSNKLIDSKQFFNPLLNEHHNNEIEGFSKNIRKNAKICPKCAILAIISLFDKHIPFYSDNTQSVLLALPNIYDLNILSKIVNNLSLSSQFIDFSDPNVASYNTNIINFNNNSSCAAAMLSLLHNIQNNFSREINEDLFQVFSETELIDLVDWIFITKDSFKINRIKSDNNVYKILKPLINPDNGEEIYLVTDFFNRINFSNFSPYKIEKFFDSFLELDHNSISQCLFDMVKSDIRFYGNSYPIYLFMRVFLDQIMGEILMLNEDFKKACKSIASIIGQSFYKDIGLMSKFAYATDEIVFKEYVEEAFFLMAKKSALSDKKPPYSNIRELEIFFDGLTHDNFRETKSYFVSFMSSSALHKKYQDMQNQETQS